MLAEYCFLPHWRDLYSSTNSKYFFFFLRKLHSTTGTNYKFKTGNCQEIAAWSYSLKQFQYWTSPDRKSLLLLFVLKSGCYIWQKNNRHPFLDDLNLFSFLFAFFFILTYLETEILLKRRVRRQPPCIYLHYVLYRQTQTSLSYSKN